MSDETQSNEIKKKQTAALVTGASMGIGLEFARVLAGQGHNLILVARSKDKLEAVAAEMRLQHGIEAHVITADLSNVDEVEKLPGKVDKTGLRIDFLVNNAGFGDHGFFTETDWAKELMMINLNITALTLLSKQYAIRMSRQGYGRICNVASIAAFQPGPKMAVYFVTKAYVLSLSEAINEELRGTGVTVTTLCPGATGSDFFANAGVKGIKPFMKRLASVSDVAHFGYEATMEGRSVAVHGTLNRLMTESVRFIPRRAVTRIARHIL